MMEIVTIELFGFKAVIDALRLPYKATKKSDSHTYSVYKASDTGIEIQTRVTFGPKDLKLLENLIKAGDEHAKVVRGINVICSIVAPRYWWHEMDTYRIGTERLSSESTMHCEAKGLTGEELQRMKAELKEGHEQKRIQMFSYQTLRRIYFQRKNHRLREWKIFCDWIVTLPFSESLIIV